METIKELYVIKTIGSKYLLHLSCSSPKFSVCWWHRKYFNTKDDAAWLCNLIKKNVGMKTWAEDITREEADGMKIVKIVRKLRTKRN